MQEKKILVRNQLKSKIAIKESCLFNTFNTMKVSVICPVCITIGTLLVVNLVECRVLRGEIKMGSIFKKLEAQRESTNIAATSADIICSLCRRENNLTCIHQWCTNDVILGRESVVNVENFSDQFPRKLLKEHLVGVGRRFIEEDVSTNELNSEYVDRRFSSDKNDSRQPVVEKNTTIT